MASNSSSFSARNDVIIIRGVHDIATDTSAETRKVEGKLDALVNLVTQLAVNQKPASVARVCDIHSTNGHHTNQPRVNEHPEAYALQTSLAGHDISRAHTLDREDGFQLLAASMQEVMSLSLEEFTTCFGAINDAIVIIRGVHDVATDTSAETRKVEGKLDALVNLVTQLAVNQKPASVARVCDIHSTNGHHTNRRWLATPSSFSARNDAIVIRGVHDLPIDKSAETREAEGKLDALVNMVTQLALNQRLASVARVSVASLLPMTTIQISVLLQ
ncbi:hypothetical protein Fmac_024853 [Flemingia macrophylla]|uniref:Uncharacterized protein n=1 Tax=Flemingia macrophylla TaxID=520843 RepID=A0ABD1LQK8_9FABA